MVGVWEAAMPPMMRAMGRGSGWANPKFPTTRAYGGSRAVVQDGLCWGRSPGMIPAPRRNARPAHLSESRYGPTRRTTANQFGIAMGVITASVLGGALALDHNLKGAEVAAPTAAATQPSPVAESTVSTPGTPPVNVATADVTSPATSTAPTKPTSNKPARQAEAAAAPAAAPKRPRRRSPKR